MPRFDIPDSEHPVTVTVNRDSRPHDFPLPYDTNDPAEIEMLLSYPGMRKVGASRLVSVPDVETKQKRLLGGEQA